MTDIIFDLESDGLLDAITKVHTFQIGDADGTDAIVYTDDPAFPHLPPMSAGIARIKAARRVIGHNLVAFDLPVMERFYPGVLTIDQCWDTMVMARLMNPNERNNTLAFWGTRLGVAKGDFKGPWNILTPEMITYAAQDIPVTRAVYHLVEPKVRDWGSCIDTEHRFAYIMGLQEQNGFLLDIPAVQAMEADLRGELCRIEGDLQTVFPPIWARTPGPRTFTPKRDNAKAGYTAGAELTKVALQAFNPGSHAQCAERLVRLGWVPKAFTKEGAIQVDETVLTDLPWPQARVMHRYFAIIKQLGTIADGKEAWMKHVKPSGRVHGRVNSIGCAPGRCSHRSPNMANVSKKDKRMRGVWLPRQGWVLVGVDGEGLQARVCASYLAKYDGGVFAKRVAEGSSADGTDVHTVNLKALNAVDLFIMPPDPSKEMRGRVRDGAKKSLYCVWFGGQDPKLGWTVKTECRNSGIPLPTKGDKAVGVIARKALFAAITGFEELTRQVQMVAKSKKVLKGIDGRRVPLRSNHSAFVFLMQAGEAAVMKRAAVLFHFEVCPQRGWAHGTDFAYCAHVHDEAQIECRPDIADELGAAYAACVTEAGVRLGMKCPLAGKASKPGLNWAATH